MAEILALVIDDDVTTHTVVRETLSARGSAAGLPDRVLAANLPGDGIRMALETLPDVILLDINMPEMDGFKVCRLLKENASTRHIPILFLTVDSNVVHLERAFDCGASDYIRKPVNPIELRARTRVAVRDKKLVDLLKEQARVDALTGLMNRAALDDALRGAASAWERLGQPVAFLMLDIDHFKQINDSFGHGVGDQVLRAVGNTIVATCRPYDTACRFGGDEFGVVLGQAEGPDARSAATRLLTELRRVEVSAGGSPISFTASAGLASTTEVVGLTAPEELSVAADAALYRAKREGRDRLIVAIGD